jgi:hypothetical protein
MSAAAKLAASPSWQPHLARAYLFHAAARLLEEQGESANARANLLADYALESSTLNEARFRTVVSSVLDFDKTRTDDAVRRVLGTDFNLDAASDFAGDVDSPIAVRLACDVDAHATA